MFSFSSKVWCFANLFNNSCNAEVVSDNAVGFSTLYVIVVNCFRISLHLLPSFSIFFSNWNAF